MKTHALVLGVCRYKPRRVLTREYNPDGHNLGHTPIQARQRPYVSGNPNPNDTIRVQLEACKSTTLEPLPHLRFEIPEAARILRISRATLYERIREGLITTRQLALGLLRRSTLQVREDLRNELRLLIATCRGVETLVGSASDAGAARCSTIPCGPGLPALKFRVDKNSET
jgi:hypothetical protein